MGSAKRKNTKLRKALKEESCLACGQTPGDSFNPIDPAHVRTFKVTQSDHPSNIISLCRRCHRLQHKGWKSFLKNHPKVRERLESLGWSIEYHPFDSTKVILTHSEVS